ncbi:MAG: DUF4330 domain-containing protein [Clostridium sp.]|nr:DUF4330 domain-containing protein [Clostridium sp.]
MEHNTPKFRLKLNLVDGFVLVLALAVGVGLAWTMLKPAAVPTTPEQTTDTVCYTVRFQRMVGGGSQLIQPGDALVDAIKNYEIGRVVSVETVPAESLQLDHQGKSYILSELEGYEDALVTVETTCTQTEDSILLDGGYALRVGATAYVRGEGYMGSGPIISIEREDLA